MDPKALYSLSYGVFILGSHDASGVNACVTNTCMQVASSPVRIAISLLNQNKTCQMIKESRTFVLSVLDKDCTFATIKHFGFQSGRDVDKFKDFPYGKDRNGNPYIQGQTCAIISAKVLSAEDLGTHTLFVAEVEDAQTVSGRQPITYADYQRDIKEKPQAAQPDMQEKKIVGWRCKICGYEYMESELPPDFTCPLCQHPAEDFEPIYAE